MKKFRTFFFAFVPIICFCQSIPDKSFDQMMGDTSFIMTQEDWDYYHVFKKLYEDNLEALNSENALNVIPQTLHFVWLGSRSLPAKALRCLRLWAKRYPKWDIYFWSDYPHPMPYQSIQRRSIKRFSQWIPSYFQQIQNKGDQSFIVRLLILKEFGGVCVDCDVKPQASIDAIMSKMHFVTSANYPKRPFTSSSVSASTFFIASAPNHPIIQETLKTVCEQWNEVDESFTKNDEESFVYRSAYHTRVPFTEALVQHAKENDLVLPAEFFASEWGLGHHLQLQSWREKKITFEDEVYSRLIHLDQIQSQKYIYLAYGLSGLLLIVLTLLFWLRLRQKNLRNKSL